MWVKICGNTTLNDARQAAEAGADALGFIFARSPRQLTPAQAAAITRQLPEGVERVGVFDSHDAVEIVRTAQEAGLTAVQLHGGLDEALLEALLRPSGGGGKTIQIIQTLHWAVDKTSGGSKDSAEVLVAEMRRVAAASERVGQRIRILVDSKVGSASGGTGVSFDWEAAAAAFGTAATLGLEIIAAGGLRPENVSAAVARLRPWGVDVASGVEDSPGQKSPARVAEFIANARG